MCTEKHTKVRKSATISEVSLNFGFFDCVVVGALAVKILEIHCSQYIFHVIATDK